MSFRVWEVRLDYIKNYARNYDTRNSGKNDFYRNRTVQKLKLLENILKLFFIGNCIKNRNCYEKAWPKASKQ